MAQREQTSPGPLPTQASSSLCVIADSHGLQSPGDDDAGPDRPAVGAYEPAATRPAAGTAPADRRLRPDYTILAVATSWSSKSGGVNTCNRMLCQALAREGARVFCVVATATPAEIHHAVTAGVTLLVPEVLHGDKPRHALSRKPDLPPGVAPNIVIGHGRFTGYAAHRLWADHFPRARFVQIIHTDPYRLEPRKQGRPAEATARAAYRMKAELEISRTATFASVIGPVLHERYLNQFHGHRLTEPLRLDPGFDIVDPALRVPPDGLVSVLLLGRTEDEAIKGLDIAARALEAADRRRSTALPRIEFVIRGVAAGSGDPLAARIRQLAPALEVRVMPFSTSAEELLADLRMATLVLLPSRAEALGMSGVEAIVAGTPVLVSSGSGLGVLLREVLEHQDAMPYVVEQTSEDEAAGRWAQAIEAVLMDPGAAFARAETLRRRMAAALPWSQTVEKLLGRLGDLPVVRPGAKAAALNTIPTRRRGNEW